MEFRKTTKPIQTQLLLEMGVPAETADFFLDEGINGNLYGSRIAWTLDALIDYLCYGDNISVEFHKAFRQNFWICYYRRYKDDKGLTLRISKGGPTKIDAIFEVIYELHRLEHDTGTKKES